MLHGNYSTLHKSFALYMSGQIGSCDRANYNKHGLSRNAFNGAAAGELAGIPTGMYAGGAWILPRTAGAMTARRTALISVTPNPLNLAAGINIDGSATVTLTNPDAQLQLIVSATGSATITLTPTGSLAGALSAAGSATISLDLSNATLGALVNALGVASITVTPEGTMRAVGTLAGSTLETNELSPAALAEAVGSRIIEAGYTFDEIIRIIAAHAAGSATGLEGANPQFTGLDGSTLRIDGAYSAGTRTIDALNGA